MKRLYQVLLLVSLLTAFPISQSEAESPADDNYLTVTFKPDVTEKYIKVLNLMTGTQIINKTGENIYKLKMLREGNAEIVKQYSQLFSMIPDVLNVTIPHKFSFEKEKAGQVIPGVILVKFKKETKIEDIKKLDEKYKTKTALISSALNLYKIKLPANLNVENAIKLFSKHRIVEYAEADRVMTIQKPKNNFINMSSLDDPPNLSITFMPNSEKLVVNLFNLVYDTNLIEQKSSNTYLFKLSENTNPDIAIKAFKLCPYVMNIKISQRNN